MNSAVGQSWWQLLVQRKLCPARQMLATRGQAANHSAATQRAPQEPVRGLAGSEGPSLWLEGGPGCQCPHPGAQGCRQVRRCSCQWAALPPHPLKCARHREALSVSVPHGIKRKLREEDQPVPILQDFLIASMRESEPNLGCCVADLRKVREPQ